MVTRSRRYEVVEMVAKTNIMMLQASAKAGAFLIQILKEDMSL